MSNCLWPHGLQDARIPCPSLSLGVCSNSYRLNQRCHPIISFCCPLFLQPSIFPSIRIFSSESILHIRWPDYWSFSFSISPSNEYSKLTSFRIDCCDFLVVQGTLKSLLQHHNLKASVLQCSACFMVQLSHPCMTARKTIALIIRILFGKVMSLLLNMLSRFVIAFLPRNKCLFNFMSAVTIHSDFGAKENKVCHSFQFFPINICTLCVSESAVCDFCWP